MGTHGLRIGLGVLRDVHKGMGTNGLGIGIGLLREVQFYLSCNIFNLLFLSTLFLVLRDRCIRDLGKLDVFSVVEARGVINDSFPLDRVHSTRWNKYISSKYLFLEMPSN